MQKEAQLTIQKSIGNVFINAHTPKTTEEIRRDFTESELIEMKDSLSSNMIDLRRIENEFDLIKEQFKSRMKPYKAEISQLLTEIHNGYIDEMVTVSLVPDYDSKLMEMYNEQGVMVKQRPLTMSERQADMNFPQ